MSSSEGEGSSLASSDSTTNQVETAGPTPARSRSSRATAGVALAVIAVAGVVIFQNLPPRPWFPPTPPQTAAAPPASGPAAPQPTIEPAVVSRLVLARSGEAGPMTAMMGRPLAPQNVGMRSGECEDVLFREYARQAVLIAARDERGLATRDELLDDAPPDAPEDAPGLIVATPEMGDHPQMQLRPVAETKPLLDEDLEVDDAKLSQEEHLIGHEIRHVSRFEKLSRTKIPAVLDGLGVKGKPNTYKADAPVPAGVEEKLQTLGLVDHFEAVRMLHKAIRTDGESPARLGALTRAYAQLAALTSHLWSAAPLAFEARAWLYAQRMVARDPNSSWALRHRAFVGALRGVHAAALRDLETAAAIDAKSPNAAPAPEWVDVIEAGMKYDVKRLESVAAPYDRLAAFLKLTDVEYPTSTRQVVHAAEDVVKRDPDCGRAFDVICANGDINDLHRATVLGPQSFQHFYRTKLAAVPGLPERVRKALERQADDQALDEALSDAGRPKVDDGELDWGVLGLLAREFRFVQVERRLMFMTVKWSVPVDEYWEEVRPQVATHRLRSFLGTVAGQADETAEFRKLVANYDPTDILPTYLDFAMRLTRMGLMQEYSFLWSRAASHGGLNACDISRSIYDVAPQRLAYSKFLLEISPYNPYARALLLKYDWANSQAKLEQWKKDAGESPAFLQQLGKTFLEQKRFKDALPIWEKYIAVSADRYAYEQLAACYEGLGDEDRWLETLNTYLENPDDAGLGHARVQVKLANYYLKRNEPKLAKPYSDAAAETWAQWAMSCAAEVDERLGELDSAEVWLHRNAVRYPNSWTNWYLFCHRTGRGDLDEARDFATAVIRGQGAANEPTLVAYVHWLEGDLDQAVRVLEPQNEAKPNGAFGVPLLLIYDQIGADAKRDALLDKMLDGMENVGPKTKALCDLFHNALAAPDKGFDFKAADEVIDSILPESPDYQRLMVARFLLDHGKEQEAKKYLVAASRDVLGDPWSRALAATWLRAAFPEENRKPAAKPEGRPAPEPTRA
ncbi:tetratricopeptide repeat protein [Paludisphaera rhizosphaerae]|uniref:tetratricopeptide repeat protein n=1 Tax=Paludisphaera rhizosphaerae TaxID=2711216 RepID=UPI0013EDDF95|nr:hypothetical protein [Paludisphaera rhizosphaerae]